MQHMHMHMQVILDTTGGKPVAFKYGQRPFQNVVCEGLEEGSCDWLRVPRRLGGALVPCRCRLGVALVVPWCRLGAVIVPPRWCLGAASVVQQRSSYSGHLCSSSLRSAAALAAWHAARAASGPRLLCALKRSCLRPDSRGRLWVLPSACAKAADCVAHCAPSRPQASVA